MVDDQPGKLLSDETILRDLRENHMLAATAGEALQRILAGKRERVNDLAGKFTMRSDADGTTVTVRLPDTAAKTNSEHREESSVAGRFI
jgi:signal transduction histidine kinase